MDCVSLRSAVGRAALAAMFVLAAGRTPAQDGIAGGLKWVASLEEAMRLASAESKLVVVKAGATWCGPCQQMQHLTWKAPELVAELQESFVCLKVDADDQPALMRRLNIEKYPTTLVLDAKGRELFRHVGFQSAGDLSRRLKDVGPPLSQVVALKPMHPDEVGAVAFQGTCLVSLMNENKLVQGNAQITTTHQGQTLQFANERHRDEFLKAPDRYWPVANGHCVVTAADQQDLKVGEPREAVIYQGRLWFFATKERQRKFIATPGRYTRVRSQLEG